MNFGYSISVLTREADVVSDLFSRERNAPSSFFLTVLFFTNRLDKLVWYESSEKSRRDGKVGRRS